MIIALTGLGMPAGPRSRKGGWDPDPEPRTGRAWHANRPARAPVWLVNLDPDPSSGGTAARACAKSRP